MPLAQKSLHGIQIAEKQAGVPVPELGVAPDTQLDDATNFHFGINSDAFDAEVRRKDYLDGFGPRILDIKNRGGTIAEETWWAMQGASRKKDDPELRKFAARYAAGKRGVHQGQTYPAQAQRDGNPIGGTTKLSDALYAGIRFSKASLEYALSVRGTVHFHLDGLGPIRPLLDKSGGHAYNVTGMELRHVWRHWGRFQGSVVFYNGYTAGKRAVIVEPPWLPIWQPDSTAASCKSCGAKFTVFLRKHHCRKCGYIFCDDCSKGRRQLYDPGRQEYPVRRPGEDLQRGPVRVCDLCFPPVGRLPNVRDLYGSDSD
jgi:hypothetical protein